MKWDLVAVKGMGIEKRMPFNVRNGRTSANPESPSRAYNREWSF